MKTETLKCSVCGATATYRVGFELPPKGWTRVAPHLNYCPDHNPTKGDAS